MKLSQVNSVWQSLTGFLAPMILTILLIEKVTDSSLNFYQWLMWLHIPIFFFHEYEEYVINPNGFKKFVNTETIISLDPPQENFPADDLMLLVVNMSAWVWAFAGALFAQIYPWIGASFLIFQTLLNCFSHPLIFQIKRKGYNPGLATTLVLFIPYLTFAFWYIITNHLFTATDWSLTLIVGVVLTAVFPMWSFVRINAVQSRSKQLPTERSLVNSL